MATGRLKPEPTLKGRGTTSPLEGLERENPTQGDRAISDEPDFCTVKETAFRSSSLLTT
jgi:hypothetical protein